MTFFCPSDTIDGNIRRYRYQSYGQRQEIYYSISEVCAQTELEPHVLRYWESEFSQLRPKKNRAGNRAYRDRDIEIVRFIKNLLYEEKFTIPGARKKLADARPDARLSDGDVASPDGHAAAIAPGTVNDVKKDLQEILAFLTG